MKKTAARFNHSKIETNPPLTEEIILEIFGSSHLIVFLLDLLSAGDSVYSRENLFENLGTPLKTCLICTETPVKIRLEFWQLTVTHP